ILPRRKAVNVFRDVEDLLGFVRVPMWLANGGCKRETRRERRDADSEDLVKIRTVLRRVGVPLDELASDDEEASDDSESDVSEEYEASEEPDDSSLDESDSDEADETGGLETDRLSIWFDEPAPLFSISMWESKSCRR